MAGFEFAKLLRKHAEEVAALEGAQAAEFLRLAKQARREMIGAMMEAGAGSRQGASYVAAKQAIAQATIQIKTLEAKASMTYESGSTLAAELAADQVKAEIATLSKAFAGDVLNVTLDTAKILADPARGLLATGFESSVQKYGLDTLNELRREIAVGTIKGESLKDIAARVAAKQGEAAAQSSAKNAERLVRTETANVNGLARFRSLQQAQKFDPLLRKQWHHTGSYPCPICVPLHGSIKPLPAPWVIVTGKKVKRVRQVLFPPGHPNCVCTVIPMRSAWRAGMTPAQRAALEEHIRPGAKILKGPWIDEEAEETPRKVAARVK